MPPEDTKVADKPKSAVPNGHPNEDDLLLREGLDTFGEDSPDEEDDEDESSEEADGTKKEKKGPDTEDKTDDDDEDESNEESEDSEDDDKKPQIPFDRPTVKAIKAEFPEFFTKFPTLKDAYFREIEFTKLFPTIEEAKESFEDNQAFSTLSDAALAGDPTPILESIDKTDSKAFQLFATSFLPALFKRNQETYQEAITPIFEGLIRQMYKSSDDNIKNSGLNIAKFIFGDDHAEDIAKGTKTFSKLTQLTEDQKKTKTENDERVAKGFTDAYNHVESQINLGLKTLILRDFDPNKAFSKFMRNQLADEVVKRIKKQLESDTAHGAVMGARWKRAKSTGYNNDEKSKIVATFLARAKSLIPNTSERVRSLALGKHVENSEKRTRQLAPVKRELNGGRPSSGKTPSEKRDYKKMSDMEILALD